MWSIGDMMTDRELMQQSLEVLVANRRTHYYCEDTWYSCPRHEEGCANDAEGYECNCGADKANEQIDNTITALRERLAQPEQEPVAWRYSVQPQVLGASYWAFSETKDVPDAQPLYTTLPQRKPLPPQSPCEMTQAEGKMFKLGWLECEAAHGIKGEA